MVKGLYTAYTGMLNEQHRMDVITNNLANSATTGYKREGATSEAFSEELALRIKDRSDPYVAAPLGHVSLGVKIGETYRDYSDGPLRETGNTFDLGLTGNGFFEIEFTNKDGEVFVKYTRDGSFTINSDNNLVTKDGDYVLDTAGNHITVDPLLDYSVSAQGVITQGGNQVAQIQVTDFEDYNYLEKYGENLYQTVEGAVEQPAAAVVHSGYLEASNVQAVQEMVEMISLSRAYETNQKMIQTIDTTLEGATTTLGRV